MEYFVRHRTTYRYLQDVSHSWHLAHLRPRITPLQAVHDSSITLSLEPASRVAREDYFQNPTELFSIDRPHTHLEVLAESRVTVNPAPQRTSRDSVPWEEARAMLENPQDDEQRDAVQYLFDSPMTKFESDIFAYGAVSFPPHRPILSGAIELMNRIHKDFRYDTTVTGRVHAGGPGVRAAGRRLPGPGACRHRGDAGHGPAGALYLRLPPDRAAAGQAAPAWRRRQPCLVFGLGAAVRLGGPGPHQQYPGGRKPCHLVLGPRLWRCRAGGRHHPGRP